MPIHVLPDHVVAQIAAGEVVERPASVIKELVENALDAGATHIGVASIGGGQKMLRVSDDGSGIRAAEVELAFARHATSKLHTADDLLHLQTLGFRGEALCSIAAVAHVTCISRHRDEQTGLRLRLEGSVITVKQASGAPAGTVITVENLFYNVPARLKFLKKETTEKRQIAQIVTLYAMAYPKIRFTLEQDGREAFRSNGSGKLSDVLAAAFGSETFKQLVPVESTTNGIQVSGYTATPEAGRGNRERMHIFINGRAVQDHSLLRAVTDAYKGLVPEGQYPVSVLMVSVPPEDVDVNVHPTKAEVRFRDPNAIFTAVQRAIREAIIGTGGGTNVSYRPAASGFTSPRRTPSGGFRPSFTDEQLPDESDVSSEDSAEYAAEEPREFDISHIPEGIGQPDRPRTLPVLRVVGQMGLRYVIAEGPVGMYLIDQHAAHQRILYNAVRARMDEGQDIPVTETVGGTARTTPVQSRQLDDLIPSLHPYGLWIEPFGLHIYRVAAAPNFLADLDAELVIRAVLNAILNPGDDIREAVFIALCRLGALQHGTLLTQADMQALIRELERTPDPLTAPDGSAVLVEFSADLIAREFKRR